jgi:transcriptional regulator with XRE-family HTH domain
MLTPADIYLWRKAHRLTQLQLADLLLVTVLTVKRWEAGLTQAPGFLRLALQQLERVFEAEAAETERLEREADSGRRREHQEASHASLR